MRKVTSISGFIAVIALLTGCMTTPATWSKVGVTMARGSKDLEACASQANLVYQASSMDGKLAVGAFVDAGELGSKFKQCMEGRGYRKSN